MISRFLSSLKKVSAVYAILFRLGHYYLCSFLCLCLTLLIVTDGADAHSEDCILTTYSKVSSRTVTVMHAYKVLYVMHNCSVFKCVLIFCTQWDQIQELLGHPMEKPVVLHRWELFGGG